MSSKNASTAADRLKTTAFELACSEGLAALSSRSLAEKMGGSPSAIGYHFRSREVLMGELCEQTAQILQAWRSQHLDIANERMPVWEGFAGHFVTALLAMLEACREALLLIRELDREARIHGWAEVSRQIKADHEAEVAFWSRLACSLGCSQEQAEIWSDFALSMTILGLYLPTSALRYAWIGRPASRLQERLSGKAISPIAGSAELPAGLQASSPFERQGTKAMAILDAALTLMTEKGTGRLNQREVASRAGVSLSAVTYFFGSKQELIGAAVEELCRRQYRLLLENVLQGPVGDDVMLALSHAENREPLDAMTELLQAAVRYPIIDPAVHRMLSIRGIGSEALLRRLGHDVDQLDGYLWISLCSGSAIRFADAVQADVWREIAHAAAHSRLRSIFQLSTSATSTPAGV